MSKISVIFGSTTGCAENAAQMIANQLGTTALNIASASAADFEADLIVLGSSTWGVGELQDDWESGMSLLDSVNFSGKKVAIFGTGDQCGFGDTFCDAVGIIANKIKERGGEIVGYTSSSGYQHSASLAEENGQFCGLLLDDNNEPEKTEPRIKEWCAQLLAL